MTDLIGTPVRRRAGVLAAVALAACAGCARKAPPRPKGIGRPLVLTPARNLVLAPDGKTLVFVSEVAPPPEKGAPEGVLQGILATIPVDGGVVRQLGGGVTTLEDGFRLSADGRFVAYLQGFRFKDQAGNLNLARVDSGDGTLLGQNATYYRFSPDGKLVGWVADGEMTLLDLDKDARRPIAKQVATFEFTRDGTKLLVRRQAAAGGALLLVDALVPLEARELGSNVGEYAFSPDGASVAFTARADDPGAPYALFTALVLSDQPPVRLGSGVATFVFSPDSRWIAWVGGLTRTRLSGSLGIAPASGGPARTVGEGVAELRWSPSSRALAFRESYEDRSGRKHDGFKVALVPDFKVVRAEEKVTNFLWSGDGEHLAYLLQVPKPTYSVSLMLYRLGDEAPREIDKWVFSYQFAPAEKELWYRGNCTGRGRECELLAAKLSGEGAPRRLAPGVLNFKVSGNGERLLVTFPRVDTESAVDVGWLSLKGAQPSRGVDVHVLPGAQFVDPEGHRVAYVVTERKREGVYVATLEEGATPPR